MGSLTPDTEAEGVREGTLKFLRLANGETPNETLSRLLQGNVPTSRPKVLRMGIVGLDSYEAR